MKKIGLLMISFVILAQAEFSRGDNDLTVIDSETKLEWQDSYKNDNIPNTHWSASVTYCEDLKLDSHEDWRLPNINELKTIVVETQYAPTIDEKFDYTASSYYWSSTQRKVSESMNKWIVSFSTSIITTKHGGAGNTYYYASIRCVRN